MLGTWLTLTRHLVDDAPTTLQPVHGVPVPRARPITQGSSAPSGDRLAASVLDACVTRKVENGLTVLLERLAREYLGEQVSRVGLARDVTNYNATSSAQLAHLSVNMTRSVSATM